MDHEKIQTPAFLDERQIKVDTMTLSRSKNAKFGVFSDLNSQLAAMATYL